MNKRLLDTIPFHPATVEDLETAIHDGNEILCYAEVHTLQGENVLSVSCMLTHRLYWPELYGWAYQNGVAFNRFQFFAYKGGFKTKIFLEDEIKWSDRSIHDFGRLIFCKEEDIKTAKQFFHSEDEESLLYLTEKFADTVRLEKKRKRLEKDVDRLRRDMQSFHPLPKKYFTWADRLFKEYIFFDNSTKSGYCSHCKNDFPMTEKMKHNSPAKCPACHHTYPAKNAKLGRKNLDEVVWSMRLTKGDGNAFNLQLCWHEKTWDDYRNPRRYDKERERLVIFPTNCRDYEPGDFHNLGLVDWQVYHNKPYYFFNRYDDPSTVTLYNSAASVRKIIKGTRLERSGLDYLVKNGAFHKADGFPWNFIGCLQQMEQHPEAEIAAKAGFVNIAIHKVMEKTNPEKPVRKLKDVLGLDSMEQVNFLLPWKKTVSTDDIETLKYFWRVKKRNPHPDELDIIGKVFCRFHTGSAYYRGRCEFMKTYLRCAASSSIGKMGRYMLSQEGVTLHEYRDYLSFLEELGIDYSHNNVLLMPKNLQEAHDEAWNRVREQRDENARRSKEERMAKLREELAAYNRDWEAYEGDKLYEKRGDLFARMPLVSKELDAEGEYLDHCVGGYKKKWEDDESRIVFLRKLVEPQIPLYTCEFAPDGQLRQIRAYHNGQPTKAARKFAESLCETMRNVQNVILAQANA